MNKKFAPPMHANAKLLNSEDLSTHLGSQNNDLKILQMTLSGEYSFIY